jgi:hypothetical protein
VGIDYRRQLEGFNDVVFQWTPFGKSDCKFRGSPTHLQVLAAATVPLRVVFFGVTAVLSTLWSWTTIIPQLIIVGLGLLLGRLCHWVTPVRNVISAFIFITNFPPLLWLISSDWLINDALGGVVIAPWLLLYCKARDKMANANQKNFNTDFIVSI